MWWWLLPLACAPRGTAQLDDLMDLGAWEAACERSRFLEEPLRDHVAERTWGATQVQLRARALSPEELGARPEGWGAWEVTLTADGAVVPAMGASLSLVDADGGVWAPCAACGPEWVAEQLSPGDPVVITFQTHDAGSSGGGLFQALGALAKVTLLPLTLTFDLALAPLQVISGNGRHLGSVTRWMLDDQPFPVAPAVHSPEPEAPPALPRRLGVLQAVEGAGEPVEAQLVIDGRHLGGCRLPSMSVAAPVVGGAVEATW